MAKDPSAIFRSHVGTGELERLTALETLKGLKHRERVTLDALMRFLAERGLWPQFAQITLADLREAFAEAPVKTGARRKKPRILEDELTSPSPAGDAGDEGEGGAVAGIGAKSLHDGGMSTDEVAAKVMPFIEGNGEVTLDDLAEYTAYDRKVLRFHLAALVKDGRLERVGVGRHAVYSAL
jgi:hypothetical protein